MQAGAHTTKMATLGETSRPIFFPRDASPGLNPFRTAVSFWGQSTQIWSSLSPNRDCGSKRVAPQPCQEHQLDKLRPRGCAILPPGWWGWHGIIVLSVCPLTDRHLLDCSSSLSRNKQQHTAIISICTISAKSQYVIQTAVSDMHLVWYQPYIYRYTAEKISKQKTKKNQNNKLKINFRSSKTINTAGIDHENKNVQE